MDADDYEDGRYDEAFYGTDSDSVCVLNGDVLAKILLYSGEPAAVVALCKHVCPAVRNSLYKCSKKLIYGPIQSGKTAKILVEVQRTKLFVVLIVQNSRWVQKQYEQRFREAGVPLQVVRASTTALTERVVVLMNNKHQLAKYMTLNPPKTYAILLDESDLTQFHPLRANAASEIHVTATPFRYKAGTFDEIEFVEKHPHYYGLDKVHLKPFKDYFTVVNDFLTSRGILLINTFTRVEEMRTVAMQLSSAYPTVPVILLTTHKGVYLNREFVRIRGSSLNRLLDRYTEPHVIIVANRMATRGISFSNSSHTAHITHQVSKPNTPTGFLQKCRILGIYPNLPQLTLYIDEGFVRKIEAIKKAIVDRVALVEYHQNKARNMVYKSSL